MQFSSTRWAMPLVAAALIALPAAGFAQTNPTQPPAQQPPAQQPPTQQTPQTTQPPAPQSAQPATTSAQPDAAAAKQHLTEARDTLSQITSMPEASRLQGDARTQVSQLISSFNGLISAQSDWRSAYTKVDENLTALLGPDSGDQPPAAAGTAGTSGTVGTSGTAGSGLDPAIRAKLVEFRTHLKAFEKAAGGSASSDNPPSAMPPSAATGTTANPANPATSGAASSANPTGSEPTKPNPPSAMTGATGTTGTTPASSAPSSSNADQNTNAAAQTELAAIDAILKESKTGALTKAQTAQLRRHVEALRALLAQK